MSVSFARRPRLLGHLGQEDLAQRQGVRRPPETLGQVGELASAATAEDLGDLEVPGVPQGDVGPGRGAVPELFEERFEPLGLQRRLDVRPVKGHHLRAEDVEARAGRRHFAVVHVGPRSLAFLPLLRLIDRQVFATAARVLRAAPDDDAAIHATAALGAGKLR
jgi:hypothetical protein